MLLWAYGTSANSYVFYFFVPHVLVFAGAHGDSHLFESPGNRTGYHEKYMRLVADFRPAAVLNLTPEGSKRRNAEKSR